MFMAVMKHMRSLGAQWKIIKTILSAIKPLNSVATSVRPVAAMDDRMQIYA